VVFGHLAKPVKVLPGDLDVTLVLLPEGFLELLVEIAELLHFILFNLLATS
jgi:hypothetical protein